MPETANVKVETAIEKSLREQAERRATVAAAIADVPQASIDLFLVDVGKDTEDRSVSFWMATYLMYGHKYFERLRAYAQERQEARDRKENERLFEKYIAMNPPKSGEELLTLMQRFHVCPQVQVPKVQPAATQQAAK